MDDERLVALRAQRREHLKREFTKLITDPHRNMSGQGGVPFDPALMRYLAMKTTQYDHFKANFKTARMYFVRVWLPIIAFGLTLNHFTSDFERRCRRGEIPYKDRHPKFLS